MKEETESKYTLAVIVRNCADNLDRLLTSYGRYPDEIVVVNTSIDEKEEGFAATDEIAKKHGAKVFHFPWIHDFSAARNFSFSKASHPWVLWLDSDDTVENPEGVDRNLRFAIDTDSVNAIIMEYLYEFDNDGNCSLRLDRERLVKKEEFEWRAPIHEVLCAKTKLNATKLPPEIGRVIHHRLTSDVESRNVSLSRNLRVFNEKFEKTGEDPGLRMIFYWGNTLLGLGDYSGAIHKYREYLERSKAEGSINPSEQYVATWSCAEALRQKRLFEESFAYAGQAILMNPHCPTAYIHAAQALLGMNDLERTVSYSLLCKEMAKNIGSEMVSSPRAIAGLPDLLIAQVFCIKGEWQSAIRHLDIARKFYADSDEFRTIDKWVAEMSDHFADKEAFQRIVDKMMTEKKWKAVHSLALNAPANLADTLEVARLLPKRRPDGKKSIAFICGENLQGFFWGPWSIEKGIGGSEEAVINAAREFSNLGWHVEVYCPTGKKRSQSPIIDQGVEWWPVHCWTGEFDNEIDVAVWWRTPRGPSLVKHKTKLNYAWMHDIYVAGMWGDDTHELYDGVILLSDYHRKLYKVVPDDKVVLSENGLDPNLFVPTDQLSNVPTKMIWGSDPSRGVDLVLPHWKKIKESVPTAEWHIYYGWSRHFLETLKWSKENQRIHDFVEKNRTQPGIFWHGRVGQDVLAKAYASSGVWGYPTNFPEIHCITAMKAQAHGCIPVVTDDFALTETVQYGNKLLGPMTDPENISRWVDSVIDVMQNPWTTEQRLEMATWARKHTWAEVVKPWAALFERRLEEIQSRPSLALTTAS